MTDDEKFEKLKADAIKQNEERYGEEARARYGNEAIDTSNAILQSMTPEEWENKEALGQRILETLKDAMATGDPTSSKAQTLAAMHGQWLAMYWGEANYSPAAHRSLADGYLADPRFTAYYDDACGEDATQFLRDAIFANINPE